MKHFHDFPPLVNDTDDYYIEFAAQQAAQHRAEVMRHIAYRAAQSRLHPYLRDTYNAAGNPTNTPYEAMRLNGD